jgi:hypothetical protein
MWATGSGHRRIKRTQRMGVLVQEVCGRPQVRKLLGAELGQFGKQIFELRSAHAKFCSENPENPTKTILFANRDIYVQHFTPIR